MKNLNITEKIGIVLGTIGGIMIVLNLYFEDSSFKGLLEFNQLVFWFGVLIWALGKMQSEKAEREKKQENENSSLE